MTDFWRGRRVLVTGGTGFIGTHVVQALVDRGAHVTATASGAHPCEGESGREAAARHRLVVADLTDPDDCLSICRDQDVIFSLAHADGSLGFKQAKPASIFRQNMLITLNLLEGAHRHGVERVLVMSSAEVYGDGVPALPGVDPWLASAWPENDGYAWSKRMSEFCATLWQREYNVQVAVARPGNVYGPGDHLQPGKARVIPSFIRQALTGDGPITIWGSGDQVRTFLYVGDLVRGLLDVTEKYPVADPVDFGGTEAISVRALAELIVQLTGGRVGVVCDASRPSGADRRLPDVSKAERLLGFRPAVPLEAGLRRTIDTCRSALTAKVVTQ